jgi:hypothetical protein
MLLPFVAGVILIEQHDGEFVSCRNVNAKPYIGRFLDCGNDPRHSGVFAASCSNQGMNPAATRATGDGRQRSDV